MAEKTSKGKILKNNAENSLTCIRPAYTLTTTPDSGEADEVAVRHFLETLAEIALSVASRKAGGHGGVIK